MTVAQAGKEGDNLILAGKKMVDVSIVVVDDHPLFRQGVVNTLSLEPGSRLSVKQRMATMLWQYS